jgi:uncharacterized protein (TIGR03437 family)
MQSVIRLTCMACAVVCLSAAPASFLVFEPAPGKLHVIGRSPQGFVAFDTHGALLVPGQGAPVRMKLQGATDVEPELLEPTGSYSNYVVGRDASKWRTRVPHYRKVRYRSVLPGVDVVYYAAGTSLEYDFIIAPGADPESIQIAFEGARSVRTDRNGDLLVESAGGLIRHMRPRVYQMIAGQQIEIASAYRLDSKKRLGFSLAQYDRTNPVTVDPVVQFTRYVGGARRDTAAAVAVDPSGNVYLAGETNSLGISAASAFQSNLAAETDAYVAKFTNTGALLWITYFGGSRSELALGVATDSAGNAYVAGNTLSPDLPASGAQRALGSTDAYDGFVAKINPTGTNLAYATYIGGNGEDWVRGVAVDSAGGAWVTGWTRSANFPVQSAFQGGYAGGGGDAFLTRVAPTGTSFTYSTYFGGEGQDQASGVAVDAAGSAYVTGRTSSAAFPLVQSAQTRIAGGPGDAFVLKLNPARNQLVFSVLLGGSDDDYGIAVQSDENGGAYAVGYTKSANFPATRGAVQTALGGGSDIFVAKVDEAGVSYATFIGGNGDDWAGGIAVDAAGTAYISGWTNSPNFPVRNAAQTTYIGSETRNRFDAVSARVSPSGDSLLYSTFFGGRGEDVAQGIALDRSGQIWLAGLTSSADLLATSSPYAEGETDAFLARLSPDAAVALLSAQPSTIRLTARLGDAAPVQVTVPIRATTGNTQFTAGTNVPWLQIAPQSGTAPGNLTLTVTPGQLAAGENRGEITLRSVSHTLTVPVIVTVVAAPVVRSTEPAVLTPGTANTTVTLVGGGFTTASTVEVNDAPAVTTFVDAQTLRVVIPPALVQAEGVVRVVVVNPDVRSLPYELRVASDAPRVAAAGIVHAATWTAGPVSPGQIVILGGSGFGADSLVVAVPSGGIFGTTLASTRVLFDGTPAPLLWVRSGQVAAVVPASVAGRSATQVAVEFRGRASAAVPVAVQQAVPGVFTRTGTGTGPAAALNEDGSTNSQENPALRGSVVVLYATGLGVTSPALPDGSVVTGADALAQTPVTVVIGGQTAAVEYAGGVPGQTVGLYQLNVRVPLGIPAGDNPVVVFSGSFSSPSAGITLSVR